jgi:hypothetical protein
MKPIRTPWILFVLLKNTERDIDENWAHMYKADGFLTWRIVWNFEEKNVPTCLCIQWDKLEGQFMFNLLSEYQNQESSF